MKKCNKFLTPTGLQSSMLADVCLNDCYFHMQTNVFCRSKSNI